MLAATLILTLVGSTSGEHIFVNLFETDSAELLEAGVSAFANNANCKEFGERFEGWMKERLLVPSETWLNRSRPMRFVRTIDPVKPIDGNNPTILTIAEMKDLGGSIGKVCSGLYNRRTPIGTFGALYRDPIHTNLPPQVAIAAEGKHILLSTQPEQLTWGWEFRQRFINAPRQQIFGNFRMLANAGRFRELLPLLHPNFARQPFIPALMSNFKTLIIGMNFDGSAFQMAIRGRPEDTSELFKITSSWYQPADSSWQKLPSNLLFSSLIGTKTPNFVQNFIPAPLDGIVWPLENIKPEQLESGDCPTIIHLAPDGKSLVYGSARHFKPEAAKMLPLDRLDVISHSGNGAIEWIREQPRNIDGLTVYRYRLSLSKKFAQAGLKHADLDLIKSLIMIFFKNVRLELALRNDILYTALGIDRPMDCCLKLIESKSQYRTVNTMISVDDPNMTGITPLFAVLIRASEMGLAMTRNFPGIKPDQISDISHSSEGMTLALDRRAKDGALTLSLRVNNSEISALGELNEKARPLVTELFFNLIAAPAAANKIE